MQFTPEETNKLKTMMLFIIKKLHNASDGHSGFHTNQLDMILGEMVADGTIEKRPTIHTDKYFLITKKK